MDGLTYDQYWPYVLDRERRAAAAGALGLRVVEGEALADQAGVVVEDGAVEELVALPVDGDARAFGALEHFVVVAGVGLPREHVAHPRAAAGLHADPQAAAGHALLVEQLSNLGIHVRADFDHDPSILPQPASVKRPLRQRMTRGGG